MYYYGDFDYKALPWSELLDWREFIGMLQVNVNLMIRTACLLTVNNIIAAVGAPFVLWCWQLMLYCCSSRIL